MHSVFATVWFGLNLNWPLHVAVAWIHDLYLLYQIIKDDARKAAEEEKTIEDACDALDSGDENDEEEYEAWKVRELRRLKRDKEEREK